jgi:hypothetical protein
VIPINPISREIPKEVCSDCPSITMDVHGELSLADVEQEGLVEDVHGRLVIYKNSGVRKWPSIPRGVWHGVILQESELNRLCGCGIHEEAG